MSVDSGKELFRLGFLTAIELPDRGYVGGLLVTNQFGRPLEFQCTAPLKPNRTQEILYGPTLVPYVLGDLIGRTLIEKVGIKPHLVLTERHELLGLRELVDIPVACVDELLADGRAVASEVTSSAEPDETAVAPQLVPSEEPIAVVDASADESTVAEAPIADTGALVEASIAEARSEESDDTQNNGLAPSVLEAATADAPITAVPRELSVEDTAEPKRLSSGTQNHSLASRASEVVKPVAATIQLGRQMLRFHAAHANDRAVASRGAGVVPNNADLREPFERVREALGETARIGGSR
jgi:hypothetical protein